VLEFTVAAEIEAASEPDHRGIVLRPEVCQHFVPRLLVEL
jgi:hypothetical protein